MAGLFTGSEKRPVFTRFYGVDLRSGGFIPFIFQITGEDRLKEASPLTKEINIEVRWYSEILVQE